MKNSPSPAMRRPSPVAKTAKNDKQKSAKARPYDTPCIETFSGKQILQEIGPAQGYSGTVGGVDDPF